MWFDPAPFDINDLGWSWFITRWYIWVPAYLLFGALRGFVQGLGWGRLPQRRRQQVALDPRRFASPEQRQEVYRTKGRFCHYCGASGDIVDIQMDHIIPHTHGGPTEVWNLQPLCTKCNRWKGKMDERTARMEYLRVTGFRVYIERLQAAQQQRQHGAA